ncbi:MAG: DUF1192 domain-containing protein [Rhodospirillales bacterium]|nr:DUF1192 domain-containing protein [Alphaproteobacteria bacterium]USO02998.1 MAG: DUF1192 domain-containing protein [Rhodospirillales bacterium]
MFDDDLEPQKKAAVLKNLDSMSVEELKNYITEMEAEILRVKEEIEKKKKVLEAAGSVFNT